MKFDKFDNIALYNQSIFREKRVNLSSERLNIHKFV